MEQLTRKDFFKTAAKYAAGATAGAAGLNLLSTEKSSAHSGTVEWPWPYQKLDAEYVRKLGHDEYWNGGCAYCTFKAIIQALSETVGDPFTSLPAELMYFGYGGAAGWGTLCGALNGASAAISLVCDKTTTAKLVNELLGWYTQVELPTDTSNQYAVDGVFDTIKYNQAVPQNISGSPLCHVSVTEWCTVSEHKVGDIERKERCARLAGDVAAYAVELLNSEVDGQFAGKYVTPATLTACVSCHGPAVMDNTSVKMECTQCHGDPHSSSAVNLDEGDVSFDYELQQNYPNPFNPSTNIKFSVGKPASVSVSIYDVHGRLVKDLVSNQPYAPGLYTIHWDGRNNLGDKVSTGTYFCKLRAGRFVKTRKMALIK